MERLHSAAFLDGRVSRAGRGGNAPAFTLGTKNKATRPKVEGDRLGDAAHQL